MNSREPFACAQDKLAEGLEGRVAELEGKLAKLLAAQEGKAGTAAGLPRRSPAGAEAGGGGK